MLRHTKQLLTIILSFIATFVIENTELAAYTAWILAFIIIFFIIYLIVKKQRKKEADIMSGSPLEVMTVTIGVLLVIFLTGGLNSGTFFFIYFLLFGAAFVFEPILVFAVLAGIVVLFLPQALNTGELFSNMIRVGSLVFVAPIAYFFGREFKSREKGQ